jgi:integrase
MAISFKGVFAQEMHEILDLLNAAKRYTEHYAVIFGSLDKYTFSTKVTEKNLSESLVQKWLQTITVTDSTRNQYIGCTRVLARYLSALDIPAVEPEHRKVSSPYLAYTFTDEEFAAIIDAADNFKASYVKMESAVVFPVLLRVLCACGLRVGEALSLTWQNVDLESGIIYIFEAKNNIQRRVPFSDSLKDLLQRYKARRFSDCSKSEFLFGNPARGNEPYQAQAFRSWFIKILYEAGIAVPRKESFERGLCPHVLRHYFTFKSFQKAVREGRTLEECLPYLSSYLGHVTFFGTEKYLSTNYAVYTDSQKRMAAAIGAVFPEVVFDA